MSAGIADPLSAPAHLTEQLPESTYRLQFHAGFTFHDAAGIVPYLRDLGVTHVYASPYLKARPGSTHGYDIVYHRVLNPEIGSSEDHDTFVNTLREHGLGLILDIVPNHMGVATNDNPWWNNVLENGPSSRFADYFDIAWKATARPELQDKVLLPVLGDPYGDVLESGQLRLAFEHGAFVVWCYDRIFPVAPRSYSLILAHRADELEKRLGADSPDLAEYQSILTAIGHLPDRTETDPAKVAERQREKEVIKRRLRELAGRNEVIRAFVEENVRIFNGTPNDSRSFDRLDELLSRQCYRLSFWRVALEEINYRRFFDVNDLAALSVEREEVFTAVHETIFRLIAEGKVDGLRVDHPDGLYDPRQYFHRLQRQYLLSRGLGQEEIESVLAAAPERSPTRWPLYVVAEKILGVGEQLPRDWAVAGTTGYEFLSAVNGLFVASASERAFTQLYRDLIEDYVPFPEVVYRSKRLVLLASLAGELNMLTHQLDRLAQKRRRSRDFTLNGLRAALREVIACFPVYRSYISDKGVPAADREHIEIAVRRAASRNPLMSSALFRFVRDMILLEYPPGATEEEKAEQLRFVGKFQQVTSPVMAKGLEDTSFYVYNRLVSLNEVGGHPGQFGTRPEELHKFNADRQTNWPRALSPLSTHDTKRSEDVRARINVLSEMPEEWGSAVRRWMELNAAHRTEMIGSAPDANEEYLLYQTLLGAWPPGSDDPGTEFADRIANYMTKALHEAKVHSSWMNPNAAYDAAVQEFVRRILDPQKSRAFLDDFRQFQKHAARYGIINSLAQTLLKITAPGVADTYQGTELPDFSLVDPDNRRPVDYARREAMLADLRAKSHSSGDLPAFARQLTEAAEDGRAKLYLTWRALSARREHPGLFAEGEYLPLVASGAKADHLFAFARRLNGVTAVVAVPRLVVRLNPDPNRLSLGAEVWADTRLALSELELVTWRDAFTGRRLNATDGRIAVADLFAHFPVALLFQES
ncbi:MAG: malto-oligosyltrehalose synthase [Planctomycetia bacterium]|nr:malto-oligosyltrehalose synthase [Planctomycetia bacterium]